VKVVTIVLLTYCILILCSFILLTFCYISLVVHHVVMRVMFILVTLDRMYFMSYTSDLLLEDLCF